MFGPLHKSATLLAACIILLIVLNQTRDCFNSMTMVTVSLVPRQLMWWEAW